jgi:putative restriction endonuclease
VLGLTKTQGTIAEERALRFAVWEHLKTTQLGAVAPGELRELRIYGGAQGIWVDKARTGGLTTDGCGVAVAILHNGFSYADDLAPDGVLYHYPSTERPSARDSGEIQAMKWAMRLAVPIFVIVKEETLRRVVLGWVDDFDDPSQVFAVSFGGEPHGPVLLEGENEPFKLTAPRLQRRASTWVRTGQRNFAFNVMRRYGSACAGCGIGVSQVLDAAHLRPKNRNGSDDSRNGLPLCALHHRALDSRLWVIEPDSTRFLSVRRDVTVKDLRLTFSSLDHLPQLPHRDALRDVWIRAKAI